MDTSAQIFNQWLVGNYPDIKALEYFQQELRNATGDSFVDMASAEFSDTVLNNEKYQKALDDLAALEDEASREMEKCLREGRPDEYNRYIETVYKPALLTNPLRAVEKAEYLKNILVKDDGYIEYLKKCIAEIIKVMVSMKLHDGENTGEKKQDDLTPPLLPVLEEIANDGNLGILRPWGDGKYKCTSLPRFIKEYIKEADNLTPALIRDYLLCEKTGKPYRNSNIEKEMKTYGPGRRT